MTERTKVGIATHRELRERALQIARGERRRRPNEPKIWFTSLESLAMFSCTPRPILATRGEPARVSMMEVSADFFRVLRVRPLRGRARHPRAVGEDDRPSQGGRGRSRRAADRYDGGQAGASAGID